MKQAVLSLSGGMDSSTVLLHLLEKGYEVHVFSLHKKYYSGDALKALNQLQIKNKSILDLKTIRVGVGFSFQLFWKQDLPSREWDQNLDWIITDKELFRCSC